MYCQTIGSYVITSAGTSIMSDEGALYLSIGEPMNTELTGGDIMISQGFLQVTTAGRILSTDALLEEHIKLYPNPTHQYVKVEVPDPTASYTYQLYSVNGAKINTRQEVTDDVISLDEVHPGIYFMTIHKDDFSSRTIQIIKQ